MVRFEIFSIVINAVFIIVILMQAGYLITAVPNKIITYALWQMTGLFLLNTLGNAVSKNKIFAAVGLPIPFKPILPPGVGAVKNRKWRSHTKPSQV